MYVDSGKIKSSLKLPYHYSMYYVWLTNYKINYLFLQDKNWTKNDTKISNIHLTNFMLFQYTTELGRFANSSEEHSDIFWGTEVLI